MILALVANKSELETEREVDSEVYFRSHVSFLLFSISPLFLLDLHSWESVTSTITEVLEAKEETILLVRNSQGVSSTLP